MKINNRIFTRKDTQPLDNFPKERIDYEIAVDENGVEYLVEVGKHNQYDEVQSYYDSVKIDKLLERIALGDTSMLRNIDDTNYVNTVDLPTTPFEVINLKQSNIEKFNELDPKIKAVFDNDIQKFATAIIDQSFDKVIDNLKQGNGNNSGTDTGTNKEDK